MRVHVAVLLLAATLLATMDAALHIDGSGPLRTDNGDSLAKKQVRRTHSVHEERVVEQLASITTSWWLMKLMVKFAIFGMKARRRTTPLGEAWDELDEATVESIFGQDWRVMDDCINYISQGSSDAEVIGKVAAKYDTARMKSVFSTAKRMDDHQLIKELATRLEAEQSRMEGGGAGEERAGNEVVPGKAKAG
uniref:RxLR effector protein n=1 Tax=Peronospora matthiolae TaxID=2874970 RepID=A0AAV1TDM1_9STRA